jgi:phenylacetate-coenzyme A ligase PaaK-like adenylate-forming protein
VTHFTPPRRLDPCDIPGSLAAWFDTVEKIEPRPLAELFGLVNGDDETSSALRNVLQEFLLQRTIDHARRHTRFYGSDPRYRDWRGLRNGAAPDLQTLPVLERHELAARLPDFLADDVVLRSICHTSGTTDTPLDIYKSVEEIGFIHEFFSHLFDPVRKSLPSLPLVLTFPNFHHGVAVPMPGIGMTFVGGVTDDTLIRDARRQIETTYQIAGHDRCISMISGLHHYLLLFTSYLLEKGCDPRRYGMLAINVTGGFVPPHWLRFLERAWQCRVNDRFTLTEVIGGASRLPGMGVFALDPQIIGEALDCDTGRPVTAGVGMLALTNLYPFVQMQPLIRYKTGDLVRRVPHPGGFRFQFLGKTKNCVFWNRAGRREWLIFSASLVEILADFPDVNVYDWFSNLRSVSDRTLGSYPIMSVERVQHGDRLNIRITVELRYAPHCRGERVTELSRIILARLREVPDTGLAAGLACEAVALDIAFVGPGALSATPLIKV